MPICHPCSARPGLANSNGILYLFGGQRAEYHSRGGGLGLRNMQERIEQIDGRFEIRSSPEGTEVEGVRDFCLLEKILENLRTWECHQKTTMML